MLCVHTTAAELDTEHRREGRVDLENRPVHTCSPAELGPGIDLCLRSPGAQRLNILCFSTTYPSASLQ